MNSRNLLLVGFAALALGAVAVPMSPCGAATATVGSRAGMARSARALGPTPKAARATCVIEAAATGEVSGSVVVSPWAAAVDIAAMIEAVCNACGYDIAPTTPSRSSTPESIWQSTKWWYHAPRTAAAAAEEVPEGGLPADLPTGAFVIEHELGNTREQKWSEALD